MPLMKLPVRPVHLCRLSASLIGDSHLFVFDTEGGKRLTQFCAISASPSQSLAKSKCLNLYNLETHRLQASNLSNSSTIDKDKGSTLDKSNLLPFGNWLTFQLLLTTINEYFRSSQKGVILIGHSAISADSAHLTSGLLHHFQQLRQNTGAVPHGNIVGYIDTLPLFRWLYPNLSSYKQMDLVRHFLGVNKYNAHNALDDSLMLFFLWRKFIWPLAKDNLELLGRASVSNIYCVDRYLAKKSSFSLQSYFEALVRSKLPVALVPKSKPQIKLYHTKLILNHLYPALDALILAFDSSLSTLKSFIKAMPQGKLKVKAKLPAKAKASSVHRGNSNQKKSKVTKKKANAPSLQIKLQNEVTKEIRKNIEEQARGAASKFGETTKMDRKKK